MTKKCPFTGKRCIKEDCAMWCEATVKNVASGKLERADDCTFVKLPMILIELLRNTAGTQAAVESGRNESVKRQDALLDLMTMAAKMSALKQLKEEND